MLNVNRANSLLAWKKKQETAAEPVGDGWKTNVSSLARYVLFPFRVVFFGTSLEKALHVVSPVSDAVAAGSFTALVGVAEVPVILLLAVRWLLKACYNACHLRHDYQSFASDAATFSSVFVDKVVSYTDSFHDYRSDYML